MYCRMLQGEHSALLPTFIKLPLSLRPLFYLFLCLFETGFTVLKILLKIPHGMLTYPVIRTLARHLNSGLVSKVITSIVCACKQQELWTRGYKTFFILNSAESTKFILLINVKMTTIVGILTFISMINTTHQRL